MFQGSIVALVTPMDPAGRLDPGRIPGMVDFLLKAGSSGVVVAGTTGESPTLNAAEYLELLSKVVDAVNGRVPVLAGTGSASTSRAVEQTRLAQNAGADAALVVTPYYNRPMQSGLQAHFEAIADAGELPLVLYNVPSRTAVDLLPETVAALARHEHIVGIKETVPQVERIRSLRQLCGEQFVILSGDDESCAAAMKAGANGVISVAANIVPDLMAEVCALATGAEEGDLLSVSEQLAPLLQQLTVETNPIPVKWAAYALGLIGPGIRLPLLPLQEQHRAALMSCLATLGYTPGNNR